MTILDRRAALVGFGAAAAMPLPSQAFPFRRFLTRAFLACVALWWLTAGAGAQAIEGFPGAVTVAVDRGKGWDFQVALILGLIGESGPAVVLLSQQAVYGPDQTTLPRSIRTSGLIGGNSHYDGQVLEVAGISVAAPHDGGLPLDLVAVGLGLDSRRRRCSLSWAARERRSGSCAVLYRRTARVLRCPAGQG